MRFNLKKSPSAASGSSSSRPKTVSRLRIDHAYSIMSMRRSMRHSVLANRTHIKIIWFRSALATGSLRWGGPSPLARSCSGPAAGRRLSTHSAMASVTVGGRGGAGGARQVGASARAPPRCCCLRGAGAGQARAVAGRALAEGSACWQARCRSTGGRGCSRPGRTRPERRTEAAVVAWLVGRAGRADPARPARRGPHGDFPAAPAKWVKDSSCSGR